MSVYVCDCTLRKIKEKTSINYFYRFIRYNSSHLFIINLHTLIKKILKHSVSEKVNIVAISEMNRFVFGTRSFHLKHDSFQIGNETNLFRNEKIYFIC